MIIKKILLKRCDGKVSFANGLNGCWDRHQKQS